MVSTKTNNVSIFERYPLSEILLDFVYKNGFIHRMIYERDGPVRTQNYRPVPVTTAEKMQTDVTILTANAGYPLLYLDRAEFGYKIKHHCILNKNKYSELCFTFSRAQLGIFVYYSCNTDAITEIKIFEHLEFIHFVLNIEFLKPDYL